MIWLSNAATVETYNVVSGAFPCFPYFVHCYTCIGFNNYKFSVESPNSHIPWNMNSELIMTRNNMY